MHFSTLALSVSLATASLASAQVAGHDVLPNSGDLESSISDMHAASEGWTVTPNDTHPFAAYGGLSYYLRTNGELTAEFHGDDGDEPALDWNTTAALPGACPAGQSGCNLTFQKDGNLVLTQNGRIAWNSNTAGRGQTFIIGTNPVFMHIIDSQQRMIWSWNSPSNNSLQARPLCNSRLVNCAGYSQG